MWRDELKEFSDILLVLSILLFGAACSVSGHSTLTETLNDAQAPHLMVQRLMPEFLSRANSSPGFHQAQFIPPRSVVLGHSSDPFFIFTAALQH